MKIKNQLRRMLLESGRMENQEDIDAYLDKINKFGVDGLDSEEKRDLDMLSKGEGRPELEDLVIELVPEGTGDHAPVEFVKEYLDDARFDWSYVEQESISDVLNGVESGTFFLGWGEIKSQLKITIDGTSYHIAEKRGGIYAIPYGTNSREYYKWQQG
jgi:hypothetical protein